MDSGITIFTKENTGHQGHGDEKQKMLESSATRTGRVLTWSAGARITSTLSPPSQKFPYAFREGRNPVQSLNRLTRASYRDYSLCSPGPSRKRHIAMSLAAPGLLPKAATPLRILAASRPTCQLHSERPHGPVQSRGLYTAPARPSCHVIRQTSQTRVNFDILGASIIHTNSRFRRHFILPPQH